MTAPVIQIRRGRQGRQSAAVELTRDLHDEVTALADEGRDFATWVVSLARLGQLHLARNVSPAHLLDELERMALRHQAQMTSAGVHARAGDDCLDGEDAGASHGAAA